MKNLANITGIVIFTLALPSLLLAQQKKDQRKKRFSLTQGGGKHAIRIRWYRSGK
jgi:hypothetical protein